MITEGRGVEGGEQGSCAARLACSLFYTPSPFARCAPSSQGGLRPRADPAKANPRLILEVLDESADLLAMFLRAVLLSCAIANAAAFIAPSRAPQWGRAAVLPPRALLTASVTRRGPTALSTFSTVEIEKELARRRQVDKRSDVLQVCPARSRTPRLRASRAWPRCLHKGYGG